ncbi:MAG: aminotransferase class IV [Bacteroidota bacterium]|nr:aminotransferase class IV [Bacteroidota bacterium]
MQEKFIIHNGDYLNREKFSISPFNRAFMYGDSIFESLIAYNTGVPFLQLHYSRLIKAAEVLSYDIPPSFTLNRLEERIKYLLRKNKQFKTARVRIQLYRNNGGLYTPNDNSFSYIISTDSTHEDPFLLNEKGYETGVYSEMKKPIQDLSAFKNGSSLFYVMASLYKKKHRLDEVLILNTQGNVIEGAASNIFVIKNNKIYTPPINEGCVAGVMRKIIIGLARDNGIFVQELPLRIKDMMNSDELFFTNAAKGIQWAVALNEKRYFNKLSKELAYWLRQSIE